LFEQHDTSEMAHQHPKSEEDHVSEKGYHTHVPMSLLLSTLIPACKKFVLMLSVLSIFVSCPCLPISLYSILSHRHHLEHPPNNDYNNTSRYFPSTMIETHHFSVPQNS